ncbi:MAG TPA: tryptophan--tRNA ligase, partial [Acidocella sp.]|nr:tryptophan--tRNA ligase [Acidocella sp.]
GSGFGAFKEKLADALIAHLEPISVKTREFLADPTSLNSLLTSGAQRAAAIADPILDEAERLVGFLPRA